MSSVLLRFASLAKECAAQSIMHGKGRYPRLPCTGSSSSAAVQDTGDRRAALFPQRVGCQKSTDPLETTSSLFLPSCLGLGGKWDSGREGKRRAGGGLLPNSVSLFHFAIYLPCTMSPRRCMCTKMRDPEVRAKAVYQILVNPHLWALPGMWHRM